MNMLMKSIDQRTNLAGQNRFEMPGAHSFIKGIAQLRGNPVIVIDLSEATTGKPIRYPE